MEKLSTIRLNWNLTTNQFECHFFSSIFLYLKLTKAFRFILAMDANVPLGYFEWQYDVSVSESVNVT